MKKAKNHVKTALAAALAFGCMYLWLGSELEAQPIFNAGRLTVTTTASALYSTVQRGSSVLFCNRHTASVFIGGAALTTANGFELLANDCVTMRPYPRAAVFFIVAAATARVDYAEGQYREP